VGLAYDDAEAIVRTVIVRHGGLPALRRLARRFAGMSVRFGYSAGQVRTAFRTALGVSLPRVEREAHAWAWSGRWRA
jgi:cell wall-associated NlpC family hydrolase